MHLEDALHRPRLASADASRQQRAVPDQARADTVTIEAGTLTLLPS